MKIRNRAGHYNPGKAKPMTWMAGIGRNRALVFTHWIGRAGSHRTASSAHGGGAQRGRAVLLRLLVPGS